MIIHSEEGRQGRGDVKIASGNSISGYGGRIRIISGVGENTSSGDVNVATGSFGMAGASGKVDMHTGHSNSGDSGSFSFHTGNGLNGSGGSINVSVGSGNKGTGGDIFMGAGHTSSFASASGKISLLAVWK